MELNTRQFIEYVGFFAVILSLLLVAYEIRQSNNIAVVNAEYELRNNFTGINEAVLTNPELADFLVKIATPGESLTGADLVRAKSWTYRLMNVWVAAEVAYENGMSTRATYDNIFTNIRHSMHGSSPEMRLVWRESASSFISLQNSEVFKQIFIALDDAEADVTE